MRTAGRRRARASRFAAVLSLAMPLLVCSAPLPAQAPAAPTLPLAAADSQPDASAQAIGDGYATRLRVHRITAWTIPPLFAGQYLLGQRLYDGVADPGGPPGWVRPAHRAGAVLIGTAFAVNVTTGLMNLWAARDDEQDRWIRLLHGGSMLVAAGGFTYAGVRLADEAQFSAAKRREHRRVATASMGLTLLSGTMMWWVNR